MHVYNYQFTTAEEINDMKEYEEDILNAVDHFNEVSKKARTYKHIKEDTIVITNTDISFQLEISENIDNNITLKPLYVFSKWLVDNSELRNKAKNKRFFVPIRLEKNGMEVSEKLGNNEILQGVVDIFLSNRDSKKRRKAKDDITEIVLEYMK